MYTQEKLLKDANGLYYYQTSQGRVYEPIQPSKLICGGFHTPKRNN